MAMAYTFHILHRHAFGYGLTLSIYGGSALIAGILLPRIASKYAGVWIAVLFLVLAASWYALYRGVAFGPFVVIGGFEGLATWLVEDLVVSQLYTEVKSGHAGQAQSRLGAYEELGSIAGTGILLVLPARFLIRSLFGGLALAASPNGSVPMGQTRVRYTGVLDETSNRG